MAKALKVKDVREFQIRHITNDGYGFAIGPADEAVYIRGVSADDGIVKAVVTEVFQVSVFCDKMGQVKGDNIVQRAIAAESGIEENPYEVDDGVEDVDEGEDYEDGEQQ